MAVAGGGEGVCALVGTREPTGVRPVSTKVSSVRGIVGRSVGTLTIFSSILCFFACTGEVAR